MCLCVGLQAQFVRSRCRRSSTVRGEFADSEREACHCAISRASAVGPGGRAGVVLLCERVSPILMCFVRAECYAEREIQERGIIGKVR